MIPPKPTDGNWQQWVEHWYPFDKQWELHLLTRAERPKPGSEESLNDLRGIPEREWAAKLAQQWFIGVENQTRIEREHHQERMQEQRKESERLARLGKQALAGELGHSKSSRDAAKATAQEFLGRAESTEDLPFDMLHDWWLMHCYAKEILDGKRTKRPVLSRDRKAQAQQRRDLRDIDDAIGAVSSTAAPSVEQRRLF